MGNFRDKAGEIMKKIILIILIMLAICGILCIFASCGGEPEITDPDEILREILKNYRTNGMTSWWEIAAVYNADENPLDYKGFDDVLASLEGETNLKMAAYVIVTNIAVVIGAQEHYFEYYEEYKNKLKNLLENPTGDYPLNDYIFAFYALRCSGTDFDHGEFHQYIRGAQKADGGFALSASQETGDADVTAFVISALQLIYRNDDPGMRVAYDRSIITPALEFLKNNINENGTLSSYGNENAESTACALSALIDWGMDDEAMQILSDGLALFKVKNENKYSHLKGGKADPLATAQTAIALGCLKNKTSFWEKLYLESLYAFDGDDDDDEDFE